MHEDYAWAHVTTARTLILRHLRHMQQKSNFLQDFLCFHSFHLQSSFLPWSILGQPEIRHAMSVLQI